MKKQDRLENTEVVGKRVVYMLIDSHALIHRAYHAMPYLQTKEGKPGGALFGLCNMLLLAIEKFKPDYIFAANDLPKTTFREMAFKHYKSHRSKVEDMLVEQIIVMPRLYEAFGIPLLALEGYEADDVIGTLVKKIKEEKKSGYQIVILTGDMDIMQLIDDDKVVVYTAKKGEEEIIYHEEEVVKKYGFLPKQIPDYKGLRGDASDNIPGIKGIGEKTATAILEKGENIENIYELIKTGKDKNFFNVSDRMFELLKNGEEDALFSRELATINCDIDISIPEVDRFAIKTNLDKIKEFAQEYGFTTLLRRLEKIESISVGRDENGEVVMNDFIKVDNSVDKKETKTNNSTPAQNSVQLDFSTETFKKLQIAIWLLNSVETNVDRERLLYLVSQYKVEPKSEREVLNFFEQKLKDENLFEIYETIEVPLIPILDEANKVGMELDREKLKKLLARYEKDREKLQEEIYKLAGESFNLNSPKQLGVILFEKLRVQETSVPGEGSEDGPKRVSKIKKTMGGKLSTRFEVLEEMKDNHPIIPFILDFRDKEKMINTYLEPLLVYSQFDNRIHTTFIQTGAQTGRFSSINPNMQNIPVRGEEGVELRECFVASSGKVLLAADYSQIELRIAAMLSGEEYLQKVFLEGRDIHKSVASKMFKKDEDQITKDERNAAKAMNFGILYGMGVNSIKNTLKVERNIAQAFYDSYTLVLPRLMKYLKETVQYAKDLGYTETLYGRRRKIPELFSNIPMIRASGERFAMNAPIQGTNADIIKLAMSDFRKVCVEKGWVEEFDPKTREKVSPKVTFILQIHDEIIYEVDEKSKEEVGKELKKVMEKVLEIHVPKHKYLEVPIVANVKFGKNWGEM
jgi:DNA polymerase-1